MNTTAPTTRSQHSNADWLDLVGAICDETATPEQQQLVANRLSSDRDAQRAFVHYVDLHLALLDPDVPEVTVDAAPVQQAVPQQAADDVLVATISPGSPRPAGPRFSRPFIISLPITAAVLTLVIVPLAWVTLNRTTPETGASAETSAAPVTTIARVAEEFRTQWSDGKSRAVGTQFRAGKPIDLLTGILRLEVEGGAELVVEGPSRFSIESSKLCKLEWGRVTAVIDGAATGFRVRTADADVVDLGTEFGVARDQHGKTRIEVFEGAVVVAAESAGGVIESVRFVKGERAEVGSQGKIERPKSDNVTTRFARSIPHWKSVDVANAGFEDADESTQVPTAWTTFGLAGGNLLREAWPNVLTRSGEHVAKLFGRFEDEQNYSGMYQEFASKPGQQWRVIAYVSHKTGDLLEGDNRAFVKLDFVDQDGRLIAGSESTFRLTAKTPADVYIKSITDATAPVSTARVRVVLLFDQDDKRSTGAALFDDISLFTVTP